MTAESIPASAAEIASVVKEPPKRKFTMWPPINGDLALEDKVKTLWQIVQQKIDETQLASLKEAGEEDTIASVEGYIDDLARSDENATLSEHAVRRSF
jgi:hypothetical protein